jgi:type IV pilus assembly protein PilV
MNTKLKHRSSSGFTLVEVLVSLLVISIGLLGVAKLVLAAMKANDSAYFRGQATDLAYAILDDMRANASYAEVANGYTVAFGTFAQPAPMCNQVPPVTCNGQQIAQYDLYTWKQRLKTALPSGDGQVVMNFLGPQITATITVQWDDSVAAWAFGTPAAVNPTPVTFTLESVLQ